MCCDDEKAASPASGFDPLAGSMQVTINKPPDGPLGIRFVDAGMEQLGGWDTRMKRILFAEVGPYGAHAGIMVNDRLVGVLGGGSNLPRPIGDTSTPERVAGLIASFPPGPFTLFVRPESPLRNPSLQGGVQPVAAQPSVVPVATPVGAMPAATPIGVAVAVPVVA